MRAYGTAGFGVLLLSLAACGGEPPAVKTPTTDAAAEAKAQAEAKAATEHAEANSSRPSTGGVASASPAMMVASTARMSAGAACPAGMALVPAGTFRIGSDSDEPDEIPMHEVNVEAFCMDRAEVTVSAYAACVGSGQCTSANTGGACNAGVAGRENHPINCVDWHQAKAYCEARGLRLPTEEEWEYAATGGDGRTYPWGNEAPSNQLCWNGDGNDQGKGKRTSTCAVGSYPKGRSPVGLDDMAGNVWEWTSTPYDASARVFRGGGWDDVGPSFVRSAFRSWNVPTIQYDYLGFRCAGSAALP
jgi:formylglycine-generating enzyme required for sulfatase activity